MAVRSENFLLQRYIDKAMVDLPAMPGVVMEVVKATEQEDSTTTQIEDLLVADAAITTKLLKVVNSAYFGLPRQVVNINQAIAILGMHQVRNLVLSIGVLNTLTSPSPRIVEVQKKFWQQSFAAASCAEQIAKRKSLQKKDMETIFIGGLLHDVGRLFLFTLFNLPYKEVLKESVAKGEQLTVVERRILGTTHPELGGVLAEKWNFPEMLIDMIRFHDPIPEDVASEAVYCTHIADVIANQIGDDAVTGVVDEFDPRAMAWAGYDENGLQELRDATSKQVELANDMLGVL